MGVEGGRGWGRMYIYSRREMLALLGRGGVELGGVYVCDGGGVIMLLGCCVGGCVCVGGEELVWYCVGESRFGGMIQSGG